MRGKRFLGVVVVLAMVFFGGGCARERSPLRESVLDSPEYHFYNGLKFLEREQLEFAHSEFSLARDLQIKYAPAYVGLGMVAALRGNLRQGVELLQKAESMPYQEKYRPLIAAGWIRLFCLRRDEGWLEKVEKAFASAKAGSGEGLEVLYLYTARAYSQAFHFAQAAQVLREAERFEQDFAIEIRQEMELLERVLQADPQTELEKELCLVRRLNRGQLAALVVHKFELERLATPKRETEAEEVGEFIEEEKEKVASKALRTYPGVSWQDIERVARLGLRGIISREDGTFRPGELVSRAGLAALLEDIWVRYTQDYDLPARLKAEPPRFTDVRPEHWAYSAILFCTSRHILQPADEEGQEFHPVEPVSGVEALLAVNSLLQQL